MTMYERYCEIRDAKGLKDSHVAAATGIGKSTFSDWKSGRSVPKSEKIKKIAKFLEISPDYLSGDGEIESEPTAGIPYYINEDAKEMAQFMYNHPEYKVLFDASRKVNKEDIEFVKEMIERFSGNNK